jgi:hypothetical protein
MSLKVCFVFWFYDWTTEERNYVIIQEVKHMSQCWQSFLYSPMRTDQRTRKDAQ